VKPIVIQFHNAEVMTLKEFRDDQYCPVGFTVSITEKELAELRNASQKYWEQYAKYKSLDAGFTARARDLLIGGA